MAVSISLAQFNRIATGKYNAGFVDFQTDDQGNVVNELRKVNNHVHSTGKNRAELSPTRVLEVKEAFIAALERGRVPKESINEIRMKLGIPAEMDATGDKTQLQELLTARFTPLTRQQVRELLDTYAEGGRGFTAESRAAVSDRDIRAARKTAAMSDGRKATSTEINRASIFNARVDFKLTDVMSVLSTGRSLASLATGMQNRVASDGLAADDLRRAAVRDLGSGVATLFSAALGMLPAGVRESAEFSFLGTPATPRRAPRRPPSPAPSPTSSSTTSPPSGMPSASTASPFTTTRAASSPTSSMSRWASSTASSSSTLSGPTPSKKAATSHTKSTSGCKWS